MNNLVRRDDYETLKSPLRPIKQLNFVGGGLKKMFTFCYKYADTLTVMMQTVL